MEKQPSSHVLEPGILPVFRLFAAVRIAVFILTMLSELLFGYRVETQSYNSPDYSEYIPRVAASMVSMVLLLVYLYIPALQRLPGGLFFQIAVALSYLGTVVERYFGVPSVGIEIIYIWQPVTFLFVPLVLLAWQYSNVRQIAGFCLGTAVFEVALGIFLMESGRINPLFYNNYLILVRTVAFLFVGYVVSILVDEQRKQRRQLALAHKRQVSYAITLEQLAVSRERNRLARELHDTLAHTLSGLAVHLDAMSILWDDIPPHADQMLKHALDVTRSGLSETRRALSDLRASPLDEMGLLLALRALAEDFCDRCNQQLEITLPDELEGLSPEIEQCYYRVAQETLENIARHAQAEQVQVSLQVQDGFLELIISDDGIGFDQQDIQFEDRFGLRGMRERAALIGAQFAVESRPEKGTTIQLRKELESWSESLSAMTRS